MFHNLNKTKMLRDLLGFLLVGPTFLIFCEPWKSQRAPKIVDRREWYTIRSDEFVDDVVNIHDRSTKPPQSLPISSHVKLGPLVPAGISINLQRLVATCLAISLMRTSRYMAVWTLVLQALTKRSVFSEGSQAIEVQW